MNENEKQKILFITERMTQYHIAKLFCIKIDEKMENYEDYIKIIKEPMDLITIKDRIINNYYKSFDDWMKDMNLVFDNAIKYYGRRTTIKCFVEQMRFWLNQNLDEYPPTSARWEDTFERTALQLFKTLLSTPTINESFSTRMKTLLHRFKDEAAMHTEYLPPPAQDDDFNTIKRIKKEMQENVSTDKPRKQRQPNSKITEEEKRKIVKGINSIDNESQLMEVLEILRKKEPTMNIKEDSIVYINNLKNITLSKLKRYLISINKF